MLRNLLLVCVAASVTAFVAPGRAPVCSAIGSSRTEQSAVAMFGGGKKAAPKKAVKKGKGGVNPALFSSGIDPKKIAALDKEKKRKAAEQAALDKKGYPAFNLLRLLPQREKGSTRTTDGSLIFPKPWGKGYFDK